MDDWIIYISHSVNGLNLYQMNGTKNDAVTVINNHVQHFKTADSEFFDCVQAGINNSNEVMKVVRFYGYHINVGAVKVSRIPRMQLAKEEKQ